tara:strand:- start:355 stop:840 length:486 start_codon:yes stop_codon:yes gene_type:complete
MNIVFLQLGSNLGDRELLLREALVLINKKVGLVIDISKIYESTAWGVEKQTDYLNQIIKVETKLLASEVLSAILIIEEKLGRVRVKKWGERLIDIDILFYNNEIINTPSLCVPHKYMHKRMFVLVPLNEIAAEKIHPIYNKTIEFLMKECRDTELVKEYAA